MEIDIKGEDLTKLEILATVDQNTIKSLLEEAVVHLILDKERELFDTFTDEQKENYVFLVLMEQKDKKTHISKNDVKEMLEKIQS
ncbi:MAG: hypothetical protein V3V33_05685 [Candidatus Lokiarchaeia archaeon]